LYSSLNTVRVIKSRRMRWVQHVVCIQEMRSAYLTLVGELEGKRPLGRTRHRWADNMKIDLIERGCGLY
jgi:hypothetical protein